MNTFKMKRKSHRQSHLFGVVMALLLAASFLSACGLALQRKESLQATPSIRLEACQLGDIPAQCGTLRVYENRATNQGRQIDLKVAVIKAQDASPAPDPIFYLAGGPGGSAIEAAPYAMRVLKTALQHRDLVLIDQRGTGGSNKLTCPRSIEESMGMVPLDDQMIQDLRECLSQLDGDPAAYTTAWGMDDLDDVRAALGYDQINLYGESYGPTAEQVYLQRHGEHVRTMTVEGVTLIDEPMFEWLPLSSQKALDLLLARCQMDSACQATYPNLRAELGVVMDQLEKQPVDLHVTHPRTGQPVILNRAMLAQGLHSLLIKTSTAVQLPHLIHQLYQGNYTEIAQLLTASLASDTSSSYWHIMNLTILCNEEWARMRPEEIARFSQGTYLRYEDVRLYTVPEKICAIMPRPQPEALYQPLTASTVPVLIISNQADPQNPPENVAGAVEHYPNSLTLIAPGQGHGYSGIPCRDTFISAFIESGTTKGLDPSCLQIEPLPPIP